MVKKTNEMDTHKNLYLVMIALLTINFGCAPPPVVKDKPGPRIPGVNLTGDWYSPEFGIMELKQDGVAVSGKYEDECSRDRNGHFRGLIKGDILRIEWIQPGNPNAAVMPKKGRAWLRILQQGKKLSGEWGYEQDQYNGGVWTATRSNATDAR